MTDQELRNEFKIMHKGFDFMKKEFKTIHKEFDLMREEFNEFKHQTNNQFAKIDNQFKAMNNKFETELLKTKSELLKEMDKRMNINSREHSNIMDILEYRYEELDREMKDRKEETRTLYELSKINDIKHKEYDKILNVSNV